MEGSPELTDQFVQKISPLESREEASRSAAMDINLIFRVKIYIEAGIVRHWQQALTMRHWQELP